MDTVNEKPRGAEKMRVFSYDFTVKYYPEIEESKVPIQATPDSAGYDLYAAESKDILSNSNGVVSLDLRRVIPSGFYGKIFSRSGLFLLNKITVEGGMIDSGYREVVKVLLFNHSDEVFSVKVGDRITQVVFMEKFDVNFEKIECSEILGEKMTIRGEGGFGSTGTN